MEKILSVIIPAFNSEKFLDKCLKSLIDENVIDKMDVIVVNDGSTDRTEQIAEKYCKRYPESFRLISQENKGHGGALNSGCTAAIGKYLKVIDADDWVQTNNLDQFIKLLEKINSDVILTHLYTRNISTRETKKWKVYPPVFNESYTFDQIMLEWKSYDRGLTFHGIAYNTKFYQKNGIELSEHIFYEDHEYATIPCCYAATITPLDLFVYNYRVGDIGQSVSDENQLERISHTERVLERLVTEYRNLKLPKDSGGRQYYCMKVQGLLLSYLQVVLLLERNRNYGRRKGSEMMEKIKRSMPTTYDLAVRQFKVFRLMNYFHIKKNMWEKICQSKLYNNLRHNHTFD